MIVIISKKAFCKHYKKLLKKSNYGIINGTPPGDEVLDEIGAIRNAEETFDFLRASSALTKKNEIDEGKKRKKLEAYLSKMPRAIACAAALQLCDVNGEIDPDEKLNKNVYMILTNKTYDAMAKAIRKHMMKVLKLNEDDGDVVVIFNKFPKSLKEYGGSSTIVKKEIESIDKKINSLQEELDSGLDIDIWDDEDVERAREKLKKLRKDRKNLAEGDMDEGIPDSIRVRVLLNEAAISKSARKKLSNYIISYHDHNGTEAYLSRSI